MPSFNTEVKTETIYQWRITYPAAYNEVRKAIHHAEKEFRVRKNLAPDAYLSDDALMFVPDSEAIVLEFRITNE